MAEANSRSAVSIKRARDQLLAVALVKCLGDVTLQHIIVITVCKGKRKNGRYQHSVVLITVL